LRSPSPRTTWFAPALLAALAGVAYLIWTPQSQDLAAASFRADVFADHGFALWNNDWYSGHYLLSYSVLYPPLGAALGPELTAALAATAAAALFALLARRHFGTAALIPSLWFAAAVGAWLCTGRVAFGLALPFGLGALLAADSRRVLTAALLAALSSLASPVGGLFVALAGAALWLAGERRQGVALGLGALVPIVALNVAFPVGGVEPFVFSAFIAIPLLAALVLWLVPPEYRALRIGAVLYALGALVAFFVATPLGGNVTRLGALFAGPVLALVLWPRGRWVVLAVSLPLLYWQLIAPVRDVRKAANDPATEAAFFAPLNAELDRLARQEGAFRVEIPPTKNRWEADYVAQEHPIARGWLRQLESDDLDLFTEGELDADSYRDWLDRHAIAYVAVPDAPRDYLAVDEVALIDSGLPYLRPVWSSDEWRLYEVEDPTPIGADSVGVDSLTIEAPRPGDYELGVNSNRWWGVADGDACVGDRDGRTVVEASTPGTITVEPGLSRGRC